MTAKLLGIGVLLMVAVPSFTWISNIFSFFTSKVHSFSATNSADDLKKVFFGGEPWLLLCKNSIRNSSAFDMLGRIPLEVPRFSPPVSISVGTINNASKPLPSGRSIYQRFHLPPYIRLILNYHGEWPESLYFFLLFFCIQSCPSSQKSSLLAFVQHHHNGAVCSVVSLALMVVF